MADSQKEENLKQRMGSLLESSDFSDVIFVVNQGNEVVKIPAHKNILAIASPVFRQMFYSGWKDEFEIQITDSSPESFKSMLRYIYTDEICLQNLSLVSDLLYLANKYLIAHLIKECGQYLMNNICMCHFPLLLQVATVFGLTEVEVQIIDSIEERTRQVLQICFFNADPTFVSTVLKMEHLSVISELEVFDALLNWGEAECKRSGKKVNGTNVRQHILPFLQYIRFLSLSPSELVKAIENNRGTLSKGDRYALRRSARDFNTHSAKLPEYICRRTEPRFVRANRVISSTFGNLAVFHYTNRKFLYTIFEEFPYIPCTSHVIITGIFQIFEEKAIITGICFGDDLAPRINIHSENEVLVEVWDTFRRTEFMFYVNKDSPGYPRVDFDEQFHVENGDRVVIKVTIPSSDAFAASPSSENNPDFFTIRGNAHFRVFPTVFDSGINRLVILKDIFYFH